VVGIVVVVVVVVVVVFEFTASFFMRSCSMWQDSNFFC
jgi:hypothetical protein